MLNVQVSYRDHAKDPASSSNPTEIIVRLIEENPGVSRGVIENLFIDEVEGHESYRVACSKYFFANAWIGLHPQQRKARPRREALDVTAAVKQIKRAVVLGELLMQNGKNLKDCTGNEVRKFGGFYTELGNVVKHRKVGSVMSETQLWELWEKHKT